MNVDPTSVYCRVLRDHAALDRWRGRHFAVDPTSARCPIVRDRAVPDRRRSREAENAAAGTGTTIPDRESVDDGRIGLTGAKCHHRAGQTPVDGRRSGSGRAQKCYQFTAEGNVLHVCAGGHQNGVSTHGCGDPALDRRRIPGNGDRRGECRSN